MKRRETLKELMLAGSSMVLVPAWAKSWRIETLPEARPVFSNFESEILSKVVDAILPITEDEVGGLTVGVDKFLERLFSRCYEKADQDQLKTQLTRLDVMAQELNGLSFNQIEPNQKIAILEKMKQSDDEKESAFFELIKSETIRGFRTSRVVMTRYYRYRVVPGSYQGCVEAKMQ